MLSAMVRNPEHRRLPNSSIETSDILLPWSRNCPLGTGNCGVDIIANSFLHLPIYLYRLCTSPYILLSLQNVQSKVPTMFLGIKSQTMYQKTIKDLCHLRGHEVRDISLGCGLAKAHLRPRNGSDVIIGPANSVQHTVALEIGQRIHRNWTLDP